MRHVLDVLRKRRHSIGTFQKDNLLPTGEVMDPVTCEKVSSYNKERKGPNKDTTYSAA